MRKLVSSLVAALLVLCQCAWPEVAQPSSSAPFYWTRTPVGDSASLFTLFYGRNNLPVVALLRDNLGDGDRENDRLIYVWLLDYSPLSWRQRALAMVPFFYWRVGSGSNKPEKGDVRPLLDLASPLRPLASGANRQLLQWTLFDPMTGVVRATTRAYTENTTDHERIRVEQTISYLSKAPTLGKQDLSRHDLDYVIARLSLRERLLGGIVPDEQASRMGVEERIAAERIRVRNWEYLRGSAERAGLIFEPLKLSEGAENYAIVWFRPGAQRPPEYGSDDGPMWRILNLRNPWKDQRLADWHGLTVEREINGQRVQLIPLAAYSLTYPRMPLLMVDFRSEERVRHSIVGQRAVGQLVSGILGLSHFANWYYFVGADAYSFVESRRGTALNRAARLDCFAQFRSALALDTELPLDLRTAMQRRVDELEVNPLDASPETEIQTARARYSNLLQEVHNGELVRRLNLERREEVAAFGRGPERTAVDTTMHAVTLGAYTHRAQRSADLLVRLDRERRVESNLEYLDTVVRSGTPPEIGFDPQRIAASVNEVSALLPDVRSKRIRERLTADLKRMESLTTNNELRASCEFALRTAEGETGQGIAAQPRAIVDLSGVDGQK